jgi:hypothetical protein
MPPEQSRLCSSSLTPRVSSIPTMSQGVKLSTPLTSRKVSGRFQGEEAHHFVPGLVPALGQRSRPHNWGGPGLSHSLGRQDDPSSATSCPSGLFPLPKGEVRAGGHLLDPRYLQDDLGGGGLQNHQRRVRRRLPVVDGEM